MPTALELRRQRTKELTDRQKEEYNILNVPNMELFPQETVYILGGGASLKDFDFEKLRDKFVIGCNDAYTLGWGLVNLLFFGDTKWWLQHQDRLLSSYHGPIVTLLRLKHLPHGRLFYMEMDRGNLSVKGDTLGWFQNSGIAAMNLGLLLGARTIVLLGFDCHIPAGEMTLPVEERSSNWYKNECFTPLERTYARFLGRWDEVGKQLPGKFPDVSVINANPGSSLELLQKIDWEKAMETY